MVEGVRDVVLAVWCWGWCWGSGVGGGVGGGVVGVVNMVDLEYGNGLIVMRTIYRFT